MLNNVCLTADLIYRDYVRIESIVVELYAELNIGKFPIDPFEIARKKGYILVPFSSVKKKIRKSFRSNKLSGLSMRTESGVYRIYYDDTQCIKSKSLLLCTK